MAKTATDNGRAGAIRWIQAQMAPSTADDGRSGAAPPPPPPSTSLCYCNAEGVTWDGQGEMPGWLQRAVNAGQSVEHFRVG